MKFLAQAFLVFAIAFLSASTAHASVIQRQPNNLGLVGYWSFDEGTSTKATDFSGNGNTGTLTCADPGCFVPAWTAGKHGKALSFDGTSNYVYAGTNDALVPEGQPVTMSAWIYPRSAGEGNFGTIFFRSGATNGPRLAFFSGGGIYFRAATNVYDTARDSDSGAGLFNAL